MVWKLWCVSSKLSGFETERRILLDAHVLASDHFRRISHNKYYHDVCLMNDSKQPDRHKAEYRVQEAAARKIWVAFRCRSGITYRTTLAALEPYVGTYFSSLTVQNKNIRFLTMFKPPVDVTSIRMCFALVLPCAARAASCKSSLIDYRTHI